MEDFDFNRDRRSFQKKIFVISQRLTTNPSSVECQFTMDMTMDTGALPILPNEGMEHINPQLQQVSDRLFAVF